jgi:predicted metal-dependent HD superfamily phosphohydrolase
MELADRWPLQGAEDVRDRLLEAYGDASRGYHDQRHLTEVLDRLDELAAAGETFARLPVELAAWFHDAVYAGAPDDEERSARMAASELDAAGVPADVVAEVVRLVLVTAEHRPEDGDADAAALSDADLGILAADPTRYAEYVASVRREYAHVGDDDFRAGRRAVLAALDEKPALFHTAAAQERWEDAARANLRRELDHLA